MRVAVELEELRSDITLLLSSAFLMTFLRVISVETNVQGVLCSLVFFSSTCQFVIVAFFGVSCDFMIHNLVSLM